MTLIITSWTREEREMMDEDKWNADQAGYPDDVSPAERAHDKQVKIIADFQKQKERDTEITQYRKKYWKDLDSDNRPEDPEQAGWDNWKENDSE